MANMADDGDLVIAVSWSLIEKDAKRLKRWTTGKVTPAILTTVATSRSWLTLPIVWRSRHLRSWKLEHSFSREVFIMVARRQRQLGKEGQFPCRGKMESWYCLLKFAKRHWFQPSDFLNYFFLRHSHRHSARWRLSIWNSNFAPNGTQGGGQFRVWPEVN